eukprot:11227270-Lingulodinium_polyedra.AAC.2
MDKGWFANISTEDNMWLFFLAMRGTPKFALPERKMEFDAFVSWASKRYSMLGSPLAGLLKADDTCVDWEVKVGEFALVVPAKASKDTAITHILCRSLNREVALDGDIDIILEDVGTEVFLKCNYSFEDAFMFFESTQATRPVHNLFKDKT